MVNLIYVVGGEKHCRPIESKADFMKACNSTKNLKNWDDYRRTGEEKYKRALVQVNYNGQMPDGALLKGDRTVSPFFFYDIDCRDREECHLIINRLVERKDELGLVEVSESASYGVHAVGRRVPGTTILENQVRLSMATHTEMDTSNKENNRVVFHGPISRETTPLLDDALFNESLTPEESAEEYDRLKAREAQGLEEVPAGAKKANKHYRPWEDAAPAVAPLQCCSSKTNAEFGNAQGGSRLVRFVPREEGELAYKGIPYKDIIAKYWEMFNEGKTPEDGDRNVLTFELAVNLRSICDYSPEKMMQVVPNYWRDENGQCTPEEEAEWRKTIENALKEPKKGMPYRIKQVLQAMRSTTIIKACGGTISMPPQMPKKLPPLIKLLTKNVPACYKPAVASAVFPALGAHLHGVKFRYWDNNDHEATFMNVLVGRQSIGKSSIKKPIEYIMEDIRLRDIPNRKREADWKQKNPGAKQKKDPRPTDICIQMLIDNLTDAVFNQRIVDAHNNGERCLYTYVDELDGLRKVTSKGTSEEVGLLVRKAFDNSMAGQERVGADSVSGIAPLRWNFNASTTPPNVKRFFGKMVNDGTVGRLDMSTIIRAEGDDEAPIMGIYDEKFADELKPFIDRLEAANGMIECPQSTRLSFAMKKENDDMAKLYDSEAYRVFSYRANVIAWLKGMVLYVAHGYKWSKEIAEFVHWSQQYNLWCKMLYFGQQLEKELNYEIELQSQPGPRNFLDLLPDEFTRDQYSQMRQSQGRREDGGNALRVWTKRGYVVYDETCRRYVKTEEYKMRYQAAS